MQLADAPATCMVQNAEAVEECGEEEECDDDVGGGVGSGGVILGVGSWGNMEFVRKIRQC